MANNNGMTIRDYITNAEAKAYERRLERLVEIGAPAVMIERQRELVNELKAGEIKVGGDAGLLDTLVESAESKKGNGGKVYVVFNGVIRYFPNARHGRYITR